MADLTLSPDAARALTEGLDQIEELVIVLRDRLATGRAEESILGNAVAGRVSALHSALHGLLENPAKNIAPTWRVVYGTALINRSGGNG